MMLINGLYKKVKHLHGIEYVSPYTMSNSLHLIQDLLPARNILNFHTGIPSLPKWVLDKDSMSLMIGAGDFKHGGILNIESFIEFDVFICFPWDDRGSLRENVEYFKGLDQNKLLCFIDLHNNSHVKAFISLFNGKFSRIEGHGGHTPHMKPSSLQLILSEGGIATNIFEMSSNISSVQMVEKWLRNLDQTHGRFGEGDSYIGIGHIFRINTDGHYENRITENEYFMLKDLFIEKIKEKNRVNVQVHVDIPYFEMIDTWSLSDCQIVLAGLLHDYDTPLMLRGTIRPFTPAWSDIEKVELVYTKEMPDFKPDLLELYIEAYGEEDDIVVKLYKIYNAIQEDNENEHIWQSKAKFRTYRKYLNTMISRLPANMLPQGVLE